MGISSISIYDCVMRVALFSVFLITAANTAAQSAPVEWGRVEDNLQLGIAETRNAAPDQAELLISLKNVGSENRDLPIGFEASAGSVYNVKVAVSKGQEAVEKPVFDLNALKANPTGFVRSMTVRLQPGQTHVFTLPVRRLICVIDGGDVRPV